MLKYISALITAKLKLPVCLKKCRDRFIFCFQFCYFNMVFGQNMPATVIPDVVWEGKVCLTNILRPSMASVLAINSYNLQWISASLYLCFFFVFFLWGRNLDLYDVPASQTCNFLPATVIFFKWTMHKLVWFLKGNNPILLLVNRYNFLHIGVQGEATSFILPGTI